ncbi:MAG TPA: alpha-galactosidase [Verrucomicrobiota bacterium]|nr:alpha-galactosidase [Verrucomicrobiota bacterium]
MVTNGVVHPAVFVNKFTGQTWVQDNSEVFRLGRNSAGTVAASACALLSGLQVRVSPPDPGSSRLGDRFPGQEVAASFQDPASGIQVDWRVVLRDGASYIRQCLTLHSANAGDHIDTLELLDWATGAMPSQVGTVTGSPVVAAQVFFGGETPFAEPTLAVNRVRFGLSATLPLGAGVDYDFSAVAGVFPSGQRRRGFLYYLERERAMPYQPLLHYNSWLQTFQNVNEAVMLNSIRICELEMRQRRGVGLASYVMDDGWDSPYLGFWAVDTNKFPHTFDLLRDTVVANGTHLGIWISPLGGYRWQAQRIQAAIDEGLITTQLDLSIPAYYKWWTNRCATFLLNHAMNYFKWDNAGEGITPHFMALLRSAKVLREYSPGLFINVTVGTWPSPFWLNHVDSTWRGGWDTRFQGPGDRREQWITYRDAATWLNVVQAAPLYPLNSLMLHGFIHADLGDGALIAQAEADLRHQARTFFGSGLNLQELYLTPSILNSNQWNQLAEAATWARTNAGVLVDTHWVGGDPNQTNVYGWAAWTPQHGLLVLRNPSDQTNSISLDIGTAFELPIDAPVHYTLSAAYGDQRPTLGPMRAGRPIDLMLQPFEVLVFDAWPAADVPEPPFVTRQPASVARYVGGNARFEVTAVGMAPLDFQWRFNGTPIPSATNVALELDNLDYASAGAYAATVSNGLGNTNSASATLTVLTPGAAAAAVLADSPAAWWRLGEGYGSRTVDASAGHDGTASGSVTFGVTGAFANDPDRAIHFGSLPGACVEVPFDPELNPPCFTIECWARVTGGANTFRSPLTSRDGAPMSSGYVFYAGADNLWAFWSGNGKSSGAAAWHIIAGPPVVLGRWVHLAGTFDGTTKSFFVDGECVGSAPTSIPQNIRQPLRIGAGATEGAPNYFFEGDVDEVAVYRHALPPLRIREHFLAAALPLTLSVIRKADGVLLTWPGGTLEQADTASGVWNTVTHAVSPYSTGYAAPSRFFRVRR